MTRKASENRRESTIIRDNIVHSAYNDLVNELGTLINEVSRAFIYERIKAKTGLCTKTIAYILNHTVPKKEK